MVTSAVTHTPPAAPDAGLVPVPVTQDPASGFRLYAPVEKSAPLALTLQRQLRRRPFQWLQSQGMLLAVLLAQLVLTLRESTSLFQDETLYLYAGHREIALLLHGTPTFDNYASYFSGAPFLYPVLGAGADNVAGPAGARALSLIFMLATTALLYALTRRLFDRRAALLAAIVFAVAEPTQFMGHLATYDAPALFLLALAAWLTVRFAQRSLFGVMLAAPCLVLAAATKYAALLFVPTVLALAVLAEARGRRWLRTLRTGALLTTATTGLAAGLLALAPALRAGIRSTTSARAAGTDRTSVLLMDTTAYIGAAVLLAVAGAVLHYRSSQSPGTAESRLSRLLLGALLTCTALLAPLDQVHLHTLTSLHKHVGYGLLFAAPMAGVALGRLLGSRAQDSRRLSLVIAVCLLLTWAGTSQAKARSHDWPNSAKLVAVLRAQVRPVTGRYLVEESEVPRYYLRGITQPYQWTGTYYLAYTSRAGRHLVGVAAYKAAIADRYFDVIALRYGPTASLDVQIDGLLRAGTGYQLISKVPANSSFGTGTWFIWRLNQ